MPSTWRFGSGRAYASSEEEVMSFTIKVKEEIIAASSKDIAELSALIKMSGSVGLTNQGLTLSISTENAKIARHIYQLIENRYRCNPELRHYNKTNLKKNRVLHCLCC